MLTEYFKMKHNQLLKRIGITFGIIIGVLILLFLLITDPVDNTPFYKEEYYKKSYTEIDSLKRIIKPENGVLQAGFSKISITPVLNSVTDNNVKGAFSDMPLAGFFDRKGASATGIHDSIFVKAAAVQVNNQLIVFIGADLLIMPHNITDSVMAILSKKGLKRSQLFFSATHTHSSLGSWGMGFTGKKFTGKYNHNVLKWLTTKISDAVLLAIADLKPAEIASGNFNASQYTSNRLVGAFGSKNDDFSYIYLKQVKGENAVIGSFSAHPTCIGSENMEISGDYPGYWQRKMENSVTNYAIFIAGAVGSQASSGEGKGFDAAKAIGESLADSTIAHLQNIILQDSVFFSALTINLNLPEYHARISSNYNLSTAITKKLIPFPENACLQAVRLGKMIWISTPSDFSGEYAFELKNRLLVKGFDSNVTSFNGSYVGYIIPGRYFYLNEYEPKTMGFFCPNMGEYTFQLIKQLTN